MSAFFVATVTIKDPQKFQEYGQKAGPTVAAFGGELMLRGKTAEVLAGSAQHQATVVIKFPDTAAINKWYNSDAYQAIIPLRDEAVDMTLVSYAVPE